MLIFLTPMSLYRGSPNHAQHRATKYPRSKTPSFERYSPIKITQKFIVGFMAPASKSSHSATIPQS